jgi:hypothetical protein
MMIQDYRSDFVKPVAFGFRRASPRSAAGDITPLVPSDTPKPALLLYLSYQA